MTTPDTRRRLLPAAALITLALFTAACDPNSATTSGTAPAGAAVTVGSTPAATTATPDPLPSRSPAAASPATPTPTPSTAPPATTTAPHRTATPTRTPAPTRTTGAPEPAAPAHSCAHHTVGSCGWDLGLSPVSADETAECKDGSVSTSKSFSGTCSHHGGVRYWFK